MGRSYNKGAKATNAQVPRQWTDLTPHKYCKRIDLGRIGRANKAQKCDDCLQVKASLEKSVQRDTAVRRQEKMEWGFGEE